LEELGKGVEPGPFVDYDKFPGLNISCCWCIACCIDYPDDILFGDKGNFVFKKKTLIQ